MCIEYDFSNADLANIAEGSRLQIEFIGAPTRKGLAVIYGPEMKVRRVPNPVIFEIRQRKDSPFDPEPPFFSVKSLHNFAELKFGVVSTPHQGTWDITVIEEPEPELSPHRFPRHV